MLRSSVCLRYVIVWGMPILYCGAIVNFCRGTALLGA